MAGFCQSVSSVLSAISIRRMIRSLVDFACGIALASGALTLAHFPWSVHQAGSSNLSGSSRQFYEHGHSACSAKIDCFATKANLPAKLPQFGPVSEFVQWYGLELKRVLEIGAGALQDVVERSVGLDIALSAGTNFKKPFVQ
jgi:hypothetical protein